MRQGFTLIELSIVLIIIGLIVGGVLVGQNLISAAAVRAQITQIEKYNTAANTFYEKYGGLPGDLTAAAAARLNFVTRAGSTGRGDGNGELDGSNGSTTTSWNQSGENLFFWEDLSSAGLIDGNFSSYADTASTLCATAIACSVYFPQGKIGNGNVVYTYSGYAAKCCTNTGFGPNFFGLSVISAMDAGGAVGSAEVATPNAPGLTVAQAYMIDTKIDDGLPITGNVLAQFLAASNSQPGWSTHGTSRLATTCFDSSTGSNTYSTTYAGSTPNCGLSFHVQAGD